MAELYIAYCNGRPCAYRYGEEWVAMQLAMEGGYPTAEEAIAAWEREEKTEGIHMTEKELDDILDNLDRGKRRSRDINLAQAKAEINAIEREYLAYYDGAYDAIKAIKNAMQKERADHD